MNPSSPLADLVASFVADEDGVEQMGETTWRFPFDVGHGEFSVFVSARGDQLLVYASRLDAVPSDRIEEVWLMLGDLNPLLTIAWLECQRDSGVVSARAALDTAGVEVTDTLIGNVVGAAVEAMGRFLPAVDAVASGELDAADLRDAPDPSDPDGEIHLDLDSATPEEIAAAFEELAAGAEPPTDES